MAELDELLAEDLGRAPSIDSLLNEDLGFERRYEARRSTHGPEIVSAPPATFDLAMQWQNASDEERARFVPAFGRSLTDELLARDNVPESMQAAVEGWKFNNAPRMNQLETAVTSLAQGQALGGLDELAAGVASVLGGQDYGARLEEIRDTQARAAQRFPVTAGAGEVAGGISTAFLPSAMASQAVRGMSLLPKMAIGAGLGGTAGATSGFLYGEGGTDERARNAMPAGLLGFGLGGAAVPVARAVGGAAAAPMRSGTRHTRATGESGAAGRILSERLAQDGATWDTVSGLMSALGPEGTITDIGDATRQLGRRVSVGDDDARTQLVNYLRTRGEGARDPANPGRPMPVGGPQQRVRQTFDQEMGPAYAAYQQQIGEEGTRRGLGQIYEKILTDNPEIDVTQARGALNAALPSAADPGSAQIYRTALDVIGDGDAASSQAIHELQSRYGRRIRAMRRAMRSGNDVDTFMLEALEQSRAALRGALEQIPQYQQTARRYAESSAIDDARAFGADVFNSSESPQEFAARYNGQRSDGLRTDDERLAARRGIAGEISRMMNSSPRDYKAAFSKMNNPWGYEKMVIAFGQERADSIFNRIFAENRFQETSNYVRNRSPTADLLTDNETNATVMQRLRAPLERMGTQVLDALVYGGGPEMRQSLARMMTATGPERDKFIQALLKDAEQIQRRQNAVGGVTGSTLRALAGTNRGATTYVAQPE